MIRPLHSIWSAAVLGLLAIAGCLHWILPTVLPATMLSKNVASATAVRHQVADSLRRVPNAARARPAQRAPKPERGRKTYKGRVIAPTMSYRGADWLVRPTRENTEQPEKVLDALRIAPGSTVADIGAGVGYFSLRIARRVGPRGRVLATDIQPGMLRMLTKNARKVGLNNVQPILCTAADARLPVGEVDLALMVDVYHEISDPEGTIAQVRRSLKPDGRLVLVEYRGEDPTVPIKPEHKMTLRQVRYEIEPMGFRLREVFEFLVHQHVIVFVRDDLPGGTPWVPSVEIPGGMLPTEKQLGAAGFSRLLGGSDPSRWEGDRRVWTVQGGLMVASDPAMRSANHLLCTSESFGDLELEVHWRTTGSDSRAAVWFRSQRSQDGRLRGYRAKIGSGLYGAVSHSDRAFPEEARRNPVSQRNRVSKPAATTVSDRSFAEPANDTAGALIVPKAWNRYTIRCQGRRIGIAVNGVQTAELRDELGMQHGVIGVEHRQGTLEIGGVWIKRLEATAEPP